MVRDPKRKSDAFSLSEAALLLAGISAAMPGVWAIFARPSGAARTVLASPELPYGAAVLFLLAGTALVALAGGRRRLALLVSVMTALASAVVAGGALFPGEALARLASFPGGTPTPAPIALCLWLASLGTLAAASEAKSLRPVAVLAASLVLGIALTGAIAELVGMPALTAVRGFPPIPFDVSLGALSLGAGVLALALREGEASWIPTSVTAISLLTATVFLHHGVAREERVERRHALESKSADLRDELTARLEAQLAPVIGMANRWEGGGRPKQAAWESEAQLLLRHYPALETLQWLDDATERGNVRWVAHRPDLPSEEEEASAHRPSRGQREELKLVKESRRAQLVRTKAGEQVLYELYVPLFPGKWFDGFLVGRFRAREWLATAVESELAPDVTFAISDGEELVFSKHPLPSRAPAIDVALPIYGLDWTLHVWPASAVRGPFRDIATAVLVVGLVLGLLLTLLVHLFQVASARADARERMSFELAESEARLRRQADELAEARAHAMEKLDKQTAFLLSTRHELAALVAQVGGIASQLLGTKLSPRQKDCARAIASWTEPVGCLVDDMIDFASAESGKLRLKRIPFDLEKLVAETRTMFVGAAKEKSVTLTTALSPRVPKALMGDPMRLKRVLVHLVDAALTRLSGGEIALFVDCLEPTATDLGLRFEILLSGRAAERPDIGEVSRSIAGRLVRMMSGDMGSIEGDGQPTVLWFTAFVEKSESATVTARTTRKAAAADVIEDEDGLETAEAALSAFSREVPAFLARLRQAVVLEEWQAIAEEAEGLRLLCTSFGAPGMAAMAATLRRVSGPRAGDKAIECLKRLEAEFEASRSGMARTRSRLGVKSRKAA